MIGVNSPTLPPSVPTDAALMGAFALLTSLGNAQATAATLSQMADAKKALDEATAAHDAALAAATQAQAELVGLQERERAVTEVLPDGGYIIKNAREPCARLVQERDLHATKLDPSP